MSDVKGKTVLTPEVVSQIAGFAARTVEGVHRLGKANLINRLKGEKALDTGIAAEVGSEEIAFDIELVTIYGYAVHEVAENLRQALINQVKNMLNRTVVEVNINVVGVHFPEEEKPEPTPTSPRVK